METFQGSRELNWLQPGRQEVVVVGNYVVNEAPRLHTGFGGSSELNVEQAKFIDPQPYSLADRIGAMEKAFDNTKQGLWHRLWYGMGNNKDIIEAWMDLVPNDYGLSVIKAGLAVLAENSSEKRQKVFQTFSTLRDALLELHPDHGRFLSDPGVRKTATELYNAVISAIEDMVLVLAREHEAKETRPTPNAILQTLENHIVEYKKAVGLARDRTSERTEAYTRLNTTQTAFVHKDVLVTKEGLERHASRVEDMGDANITYREEESRRCENNHSQVLNALRGNKRELQRFTQSFQEGAQALNRTLLLRFIFDQQKHTAVVSLEHLCDILARPLSAHDADNPPNLERMLQHPSADLGHALAEQGRFPLKAQGQVQSLLTTAEFFDWMSCSHPTLLLVDANILESALESLSAISVFSSTLVTSLIEAYPDAVAIHFFCGMHASPSDAWYGPRGLVRSLILQLLMKLDAKDPDMSRFLENLKQQCLNDLCFALHSLLYEFPPDTYIYCIIDSISCFDVSRLLKDLGTVMEYLRNIVNDNRLVPIFKVFITNPGESTWAIKNMPLFKEDPSRLVCLSRVNLVPAQISGRAVGDHLLRASSHMSRDGDDDLYW
ncbi:hypothetical protein BDV11DRAFT_215287 [Aspergillus similis]